MSEKQYLPNPPAVIELDMRALFPEDYQDEVDDVLEQYQMAEEHRALQGSIKRKQQRLRHHQQ